MSPKEYIKARQEAMTIATAQQNSQQQQGQGQESVNKTPRFVVNGQPYLPLLMAIKDDEDSIKNVVIEMFQLDNHITNTNANNSKKEIANALQVTRIQGGNTNQLYCISGTTNDNNNKNDNDYMVVILPTNNNKVLLRIFGAEGIIDRDVETSTYAALAQTYITTTTTTSTTDTADSKHNPKKGIALKYYGRFGNGRLEEWCDTMVALQDADMAKPIISKGIARALAKLHGTFTVPSYYYLLPQESNDQKRNNNNATTTSSTTTSSSLITLWIQLNDWLQSALQIQTYKTEYDTQRANGEEYQLNRIIPTLQDELEWLQSIVIPIQQQDDNDDNNHNNNKSSSPSFSIGFCHNDALASNILCDPNVLVSSTTTSPSSSSTTTTAFGEKETNNNDDNNIPTLQLLDFEYGGINYYSYDIANHFNEFAGGTNEPTGTPNYSLFPSMELQRLFCTEYLKTMQELKLLQQQQKGQPPNDILVAQHDDHDATQQQKQQVDDLLYEIQGFVLANHLVWGLWGINQAAQEGCQNFDYLHYAHCRLKRYYQVKETWLLEQQQQQL